MPLCSLLVVPTDARAAQGFIFDHDQFHRSMTDALGPPSKPRLLDPATIQDTTTPAGYWHFDHQNGHDDFNLALFGTQLNQNMADNNLLEPASLAWWTFVNHQEHFLINQIP
jgi:hypothetical protein